MYKYMTRTNECLYVCCKENISENKQTQFWLNSEYSGKTCNVIKRVRSYEMMEQQKSLRPEDRVCHLAYLSSVEVLRLWMLPITSGQRAPSNNTVSTNMSSPIMTQSEEDNNTIVCEREREIKSQ